MIDNILSILGIDNEIIRSFEEYCGIKLPKEFLKKYNGAITETNIFKYDGRE